SARQREDRQRTTELGVLVQLFITTDRTQAVRVLLEARGHADAGPATDSGEHADVLLALVLIREDVADDAGRRLELVELLVDVAAIDALEVALERAVAGDATGGRQHTAPDRELFGLGLDDLARARIPLDQVAHAAMAVRRREH